MKKILLVMIMMIPLMITRGQKIGFFMIDVPEKVLENTLKLTILPFEDVTNRGSAGKGQLFAEYLAVDLMNENRGIKNTGVNLFSSGKEGVTYLSGVKTNVFSIVERSQLDQVLAEQKLSNSGLIDDSQAAEIGRVLGIDVIITGSISYNSKDENNTTEYSDLQGKKHYTHCTKRTVNVEVRLKILHVSTAQIIGTKESKSSTYENKCDEQRSGLSSVQALTEKALRTAAGQVADYFAPHYVYETVELEKIKTKEHKEKAKDAMDMAEGGNLQGAYSIYKSILDADSYNAQAAFNIGCLYYMTGNFDKALEYWRMAGEIDPSSFGSHAAKANEGIEKVKILARCGVTVVPGEFTAKQNALADKVTTKGTKGDRFEVHQAADPSSEVIARVPGDTDFTVVERGENFVLIRLLGGKQGYISKKDVR